MPYFPIKGFEPDADPTEQGVLTDCNLLIPTLNGMKAMPTEVDAEVDIIASVVASAVSFVLLDGETYRLIAGTDDKLWELNGTSWTDRTSKSAGSSAIYSTTPSVRWTFAIRENEIFAAQKGETLQHSDNITSGGSQTFRTMSRSGVLVPRGRIVETVDEFVFMFDVDDSEGLNTYGDDPNRWWCSGAGAPDSWTPSIATQSTTGHLVDTPGPITAGKRLGSDIIVYKQQAMYLGRYVGAPEVWRFNLIPGEGLGTWSPFSVVDIETAHLFAGYDNFYMFDGSRPVPIGTNRVANFFLENLNFNNADQIISYHDRRNWRVFWWYPTGTDGTLDSYLCYNYRSDRWGAGRKTVPWIFNFVETGITYDALDTYGGGLTYDTLPNVSYDEAFKAAGTPQMAIFDTNTRSIQKMTGPAGSSSYNTWDMGQEDMISVVTRVRPRFYKRPGTGTAAHYFKDVMENTIGSVCGIVTLSDQSSFDNVHAARWHRFKHDYTGDMEILGLDVAIKADGLE